MFHLQHDVGKWCTEYTYSAEDSMWGVKFLHNFGRLGLSGDSDITVNRSGLKRIDEEEPTEGGLKGRLSAGAEFYFSAKERSAGGVSFTFLRVLHLLNNLYVSFDWCPIHDASGRDAAVFSNVLSLLSKFNELWCPSVATTNYNNCALQSDARTYVWCLFGSSFSRLVAIFSI
jgi:hypothetical protein